ncbi:MAG: RNA-binding protein [Ghiorsea sp.]
MSKGCIIKAVGAAAGVAVVGYFVGSLLGETMPTGSVLASGLFVGCLLGVFGSSCCKNRCKSASGQSKEGVLYVGNIPFKAREEEVQRLFETYGTVKSVRLVRGGPSRRPKGYGFVEMSSQPEATAAVALNGQEFAGRELRVSEARDKKEY